MKGSLSSRLLAASLIIVTILGGCALYEAYRPVVLQVAPDDALISLDIGEPLAQAPVFVTRTDNAERQDYALIKGQDVQVELVYVTIVDEPVALAYPYTIESMIETWRMNRGQAKIWGASDKLDTVVGRFFYKRYRLDEQGRDCAGFSREWDHPADDPFHRPGRVLFGYVCAAPGTALSDDKITTLLRNIRTKKEPKSEPSARPVAQEVQALALARGEGFAERGNLAFPFDFARRYSDVDGNEREPLLP